jgi:hypothetical protein
MGRRRVGSGAHREAEVAMVFLVIPAKWHASGGRLWTRCKGGAEGVVQGSSRGRNEARGRNFDGESAGDFLRRRRGETREGGLGGKERHAVARVRGGPWPDRQAVGGRHQPGHGVRACDQR